MLIKSFQLGQMETNCYIATDESTLECVVIDPGDESNTVLDYIEENGLKPVYVFLTHGHFDHTGAAEAVSEETGAAVFIHRADMNDTPEYDDFYSYAVPENTKYYKDGDTITVGNMNFEIIGTPGHTPGSVTIRTGDVLFTGDTLFRGGCGRVDFPGGDMIEIMQSLKKLALLEGNYEVYPGHMDPTTLDIERGENPFVRCAMGVS